MSSERFDGMFMEIAGGCGGLEPLFSAFFSFLQRKTDLYVVADVEELRMKVAKMGFAEGAAEQLLLKSFRQFPFKRLGPSPPAPKPAAAAKATKAMPKASAAANPPAPAPSSAPSSASSPVPLPAAPPLNEKGEQVPVGNGGVTDTYHWTQTLYETSVYVTVPPGTRGKDIDCTIAASTLSLSLKGSATPLVKGEFPYAIRTDESLWSIDSESSVVVLTLDKAKKTWWDSVVKGDQKIDTSKVDSSMKMDEYDSATQGQIRKLMHEQKLTRMGLPTQEEQNMADMMAKMPPHPDSV